MTADGLRSVIEKALSVAPGLAPATHIETRVGLRPMSPDLRPILGPTNIDGLFVLTGLGPVGLTMGPYAGRLLAEHIIGSSPAIDISPYSPDRF